MSELTPDQSDKPGYSRYPMTPTMAEHLRGIALSSHLLGIVLVVVAVLNVAIMWTRIWWLGWLMGVLFAVCALSVFGHGVAFTEMSHKDHYYYKDTLSD